MPAFIDETGNKHGRLSVISRAPNNKHRKVTWHCICECGKQVSVDAAKLRNGETQSCACKKKEHALSHGHTKGGKLTRVYQCWANAVQRTTNPNDPAWEDYGKRGIKMFPDWVSSFEAFRDYVQTNLPPHPGTGWSVNRINNNGNYWPGNLEWSDASDQGFNQRKRKGSSSQYRGVKRNGSRWQSSITMPHYGGEKYLGRFSAEMNAALTRDIAVVRYGTPALLNFPELIATYKQYIACEDAIAALQETYVPKLSPVSVTSIGQGAVA